MSQNRTESSTSPLLLPPRCHRIEQNPPQAPSSYLLDVTEYNRILHHLPPSTSNRYVLCILWQCDIESQLCLASPMSSFQLSQKEKKMEGWCKDQKGHYKLYLRSRCFGHSLKCTWIDYVTSGYMERWRHIQTHVDRLRHIQTHVYRLRHIRTHG